MACCSMEAEASRPVSHCVYLAVQGRSGEASGPGQVGRSGRYPAGEWVWLRVGLKARARGNTGAGEGRAQDALEDSWPSIWHNGTGREAGKEADLSSGSLWVGQSQIGHSAGGIGASLGREAVG